MSLNRPVSVSTAPWLAVPVNTAKRLPLTIRAWASLLFVVPAAVSAYWPAVYAVYAVLFGIAMLQFLSYPKTLKVPIIFVIDIFALMTIGLFYIGDTPTQVNVSALISVRVVLILCFSNIVWTNENVLSFARQFGRALIFLIIAAVFLSFLGGRLGTFDDPIERFAISHRLMLLVQGGGHSILIDIGFFGAAFAASNIYPMKSMLRLIIFSLSILILALTNTLTSYLTIFSVSAIYFLEFLGVGRRLQIAIYIIVALVIYAVVATSTMDNTLTFIRERLQGNSVEVYRGDLTAGRALLNQLMIEAANSSPWIGVGHSDQLLQSGTSIYGDGSGLTARTESSLRLAAKYGWIYFGIFCLLISQAARGILCLDRSRRIFSLSVFAFLCIFSASSSLFEAPHSYQVYIYFPLLYIFASRSFIYPPPANINMQRQVAERSGI